VAPQITVSQPWPFGLVLLRMPAGGPPLAAMWRRPRCRISAAGHRQWGAGRCGFPRSPYNVRIGGHAVAAGRHREFAMASGEMSEAEFRSFLTDTLGAAARVSRDGAVHFVCMDWRHMDDVSAVGLTRRSR